MALCKTVGELKEAIAAIPDDLPILIELLHPEWGWEYHDVEVKIVGRREKTRDIAVVHLSAGDEQ